MYTIKGFIAEDGKVAVLASGKDWAEARKKAIEFRKQALAVEIWHDNGVRIPEPGEEEDLDRPSQF